MKIKKIAILTLLFAFTCCLSFSFPTHMILLRGDAVIPGNNEAIDFYAPFTLNFSKDLRVFVGGLQYDFTPFKYLSIGVGYNYHSKDYLINYTSGIWDHYMENAVEPYAVARLFYPINKDLDIYLGATGGILTMINSKIESSYTPDYLLNGSTPAYSIFGGAAIISGNLVTMLDLGYKFEQIKPVSYTLNSHNGTLKNVSGSDAYINFGGFYIGAYFGVGFGGGTKTK
jgi:hypothetical protein